MKNYKRLKAGLLSLVLTATSMLPMTANAADIVFKGADWSDFQTNNGYLTASSTYMDGNPSNFIRVKLDKNCRMVLEDNKGNYMPFTQLVNNYIQEEEATLKDDNYIVYDDGEIDIQYNSYSTIEEALKHTTTFNTVIIPQLPEWYKGVTSINSLNEWKSKYGNWVLHIYNTDSKEIESVTYEDFFINKASEYISEFNAIEDKDGEEESSGANKTTGISVTAEVEEINNTSIKLKYTYKALDTKVLPTGRTEIATERINKKDIKEYAYGIPAEEDAKIKEDTKSFTATYPIEQVLTWIDGDLSKIGKVDCTYLMQLTDHTYIGDYIEIDFSKYADSLKESNDNEVQPYKGTDELTKKVLDKQGTTVLTVSNQEKELKVEYDGIPKKAKIGDTVTVNINTNMVSEVVCNGATIIDKGTKGKIEVTENTVIHYTAYADGQTKEGTIEINCFKGNGTGKSEYVLGNISDLIGGDGLERLAQTGVEIGVIGIILVISLGTFIVSVILYRKRKLGKILAIILAFTMVATMTPVNTVRVEAEGTGTGGSGTSNGGRGESNRASNGFIIYAVLRDKLDASFNELTSKSSKSMPESYDLLKKIAKWTADEKTVKEDGKELRVSYSIIQDGTYNVLGDTGTMAELFGYASNNYNGDTEELAKLFNKYFATKKPTVYGKRVKQLFNEIPYKTKTESGETLKDTDEEYYRYINSYVLIVEPYEVCYSKGADSNFYYSYRNVAYSNGVNVFDTAPTVLNGRSDLITFGNYASKSSSNAYLKTAFTKLSEAEEKKLQPGTWFTCRAFGKFGQKTYFTSNGDNVEKTIGVNVKPENRDYGYVIYGSEATVNEKKGNGVFSEINITSILNGKIGVNGNDEPVYIPSFSTQDTSSVYLYRGYNEKSKEYSKKTYLNTPSTTGEDEDLNGSVITGKDSSIYSIGSSLDYITKGDESVAEEKHNIPFGNLQQYTASKSVTDGSIKEVNDNNYVYFYLTYAVPVKFSKPSMHWQNKLARYFCKTPYITPQGNEDGTVSTVKLSAAPSTVDNEGNQTYTINKSVSKDIRKIFDFNNMQWYITDSDGNGAVKLLKKVKLDGSYGYVFRPQAAYLASATKYIDGVIKKYQEDTNGIEFSKAALISVKDKEKNEIHNIDVTKYDNASELIGEMNKRTLELQANPKYQTYQTAIYDEKTGKYKTNNGVSSKDNVTYGTIRVNLTLALNLKGTDTEEEALTSDIIVVNANKSTGNISVERYGAANQAKWNDSKEAGFYGEAEIPVIEGYSPFETTAIKLINPNVGNITKGYKSIIKHNKEDDSKVTEEDIKAVKELPSSDFSAQKIIDTLCNECKSSDIVLPKSKWVYKESVGVGSNLSEDKVYGFTYILVNITSGNKDETTADLNGELELEDYKLNEINPDVFDANESGALESGEVFYAGNTKKDVIQHIVDEYEGTRGQNGAYNNEAYGSSSDWRNDEYRAEDRNFNTAIDKVKADKNLEINTTHKVKYKAKFEGVTGNGISNIIDSQTAKEENLTNGKHTKNWLNCTQLEEGTSLGSKEDSSHSTVNLYYNLLRYNSGDLRNISGISYDRNNLIGAKLKYNTDVIPEVTAKKSSAIRDSKGYVMSAAEKVITGLNVKYDSFSTANGVANTHFTWEYDDYDSEEAEATTEHYEMVSPATEDSPAEYDWVEKGILTYHTNYHTYWQYMDNIRNSLGDYTYNPVEPYQIGINDPEYKITAAIRESYLKYQTEAEEDIPSVKDRVEVTGSTDSRDNNSVWYKMTYTKNQNLPMKYYPEVQMLYQNYENNKVTGYLVDTMGEEERHSNSASLYLYRVSNKDDKRDDTDITGKTVSSGFTTGMSGTASTTIYNGSEFTVNADLSMLRLKMYGYTLDVFNPDTELKDNTILKTRGNRSNIVNDYYKDSTFYSAWENDSENKKRMEEDFTAWAKYLSTASNYGVDLECNVGDRHYSNFDAQLSTLRTAEASDIIYTDAYPLMIKNGKIVTKDTEFKPYETQNQMFGTSYTDLITSIAEDYNVSYKEAERVFKDSDIMKAIKASIESSNGKGLTNNSSDGTNDLRLDNVWNDSKWYDEGVKTIVIRRYRVADPSDHKLDGIPLTSIIAQDKLDYENADGATTSGGTSHIGKWYVNLYLTRNINGLMPQFNQNWCLDSYNLESADLNRDLKGTVLREIYVKNADFYTSNNTTDILGW